MSLKYYLWGLNVQSFMSEFILQVENLTVRHVAKKEQHVLIDGVSFGLSKGEILGITGVSGSGKSLTSLAIMGLLSFYENFNASGDVLLGKYNMLNDNENVLSKIRGKDVSMIFQQPDTLLNPLLTCGAQLKETINIHQKSIGGSELDQKCLDLLSEVGLQDAERILRSHPHQISGGQLQRFVVAMAIAHRPSIIICDEVTSALDTKSSKVIIDLILTLNKKYQTAIIFVTHDLVLLQKVSHRILMMNSGKIVDDFKNTAHGLSLASDYTQNYLKMASVKFQRSPLNEESEVVLNLKNISKSFGQGGFPLWSNKKLSKILNEITLRVQERQMVGICGVSGSGKSTLGKIIVGLLSQDSGTISYKGQQITAELFNEDKLLRRQIQMVFQDALSSLNSRLTVYKIWLEVLNLINEDDNNERAIHKMLNDLGLEPEVLDKYPQMLSGGQRQRVVLGRILLARPKVIVFDEALSALDIINQNIILELIINLQEKWGFAGIFISHDARLIDSICHRVYCIEKGQLFSEVGDDFHESD